MPAHAAGTGLATIEARDPVSGAPMRAHVFYPTAARADAPAGIGGYQVDATPGAAIARDRYPLVLISHGQGGESLGHHDLATHLAAHGFVVAAVEHPRDNLRDPGGAGQPEVLFGRPRQISALLDHLLQAPEWRDRIDPHRIGMAGFSDGGYTGLVLLGAVPRFGRYLGYCRRQSQDRKTCDFVDRLVEDGGHASAEAFTRDLDGELHRWGAPADARIRAAFLMAPTSVPFDADGLAAVTAPVFVAYAEQDRILPPAENAGHLLALLPDGTGQLAVPDADHWVFLPTCPAAMAQAAPTICTDPPGVDRGAVHARVNARALAFFRETLVSQAGASARPEDPQVD
ncbi:hypothetical protein LDO26_04220 [Luteimonas sp. BDR2-5]|uniref:alpha/beta hydrolase family protein n=1 Tax=Proluteimonas luteida TaxID=2878685 RepID=UPI001E5C65EE|nr:hypothetical protein [Luteimonas sp. BDR2-5]MCD9027420.1 hypothetical protein [Luteimonas sp. BDR2-5]